MGKGTRLGRLYRGAWLTLTSRFPVGTNVFEREWDALILLDTCRVDALRAVADEYPFIGEVDGIISVGSTSHEWVAQTFREKYRDEISRTVYVSANAFAKRVIENRDLPGTPAPVSWDIVDPEVFLLLDQAWERQPDHPYKHMLPEHLTDRAITVGREYDADRLVVHYLQPHAPYIAAARREERDLHPYEADPFECLENGTVDRDTVWNAYLDDLRMGLDSVELLLRNLDAEKVVISADHGEAFGRLGQYRHPAGCLHPSVKRVPWAETTAKDSGEYEPSFDPNVADTRDVEEHLKDLGYR